MTCRPPVRAACLLALLLPALHGTAARGLDFGFDRSSPGRPSRDRGGAFSTEGLLPKKEIGALALRRAHPRADGRGVVVAIFDTGLDPGAPGLSVTTDGEPKIVDLVDASGSGDVDTSTVRSVEDERVESLTGRRLTLGRGPRWRCPSGEVHVGAKPAWELFPGGLVSRLKEKRRERFDEAHRAVEARLLGDLARLSDEAPDDQRKELEARLERLREAAKRRQDLGPVLDCVVFHDGTRWRAAIDTDEDGDLGDEAVLASYREEREHATFGEEDLLNFAVNVYDDGDLLSIVTESGAHGTHVAGIVAGHFPDRPELDGIAPGAQLVGVKIGDTRVGASSLGTGEARGLAAVLRDGCRVINMSYGGPSPLPDAGRMASLYSEIVNDHGVVFVSSAGNNGPALSTVGSPGGTTSAILGIGATVTPAMMRSGYSLRESLPENQYTWSSRGPTLDGDMGVDVTAPGGAISPVPNWVLQQNMLMNGTSMSSPSVAGGVALLISGLQQAGKAWSPASLRRALQATARPVAGQDPWSQGAGLVQLDAALEHALEAADRDDVPVRYVVGVSGASGRRGVYLREPHETDRVQDARVTVTAAFPDGWDNRERVAYQKRVTLSASAPWVEAPEQVLLMHGGRGFDVRVDPTALPEGVHHAEILGRDAEDGAAGPLFRIPITVVRPRSPAVAPGETLRETLTFQPGDVRRLFLAVPDGATWADVALRSSAADERRLFVLQAVQLLPGRSYSDTSRRWYVWLEPGEEVVRSLPVQGGRTLEVALAQYWSSLGTSRAELEVSLHGLVARPSEILVGPGAAGARVDVSAPLRREEVHPEARLTVLRRVLRPVEAKIAPREGERDLLPKGRREHELVLEYSFSLDEESTVTPRVAPVELPGADELLESGLFMLTDSAKRRVATGVVGDGVEEVGKGEHRLRILFRHDDPAVLSRLEEAVAWLDVELGSAVTLPVRPSVLGVAAGEGVLGRGAVDRGATMTAWIAAPGNDDVPKAARPGDLLVGRLRLGTDGSPLGGAGSRPDGWPLLVAVPPPGEKDGDEKDEDGDGDDAQPSSGDEPEPPLADLERDSLVELLSELREDDRGEAFDALAARLLREHPRHVPLLLEVLKERDGEDAESGPVLEAAEAVLAALDVEALAAWRGRDRDEDEEDADQRRVDEERERELEALRAALSAKGRHARDDAALAATVDELARWVDDDDEGLRELQVRRERARSRPGRALQVLDGLIADRSPDRELVELRVAILRELGWDHLADEEERWLSVRFPDRLPPL